MTVGELKKALYRMQDNNAKVYFERIEDSYFINGGWDVKIMPSSVGTFDDEKSQFVELCQAIKYKDDDNLYLTSHY